MYEEYLEEIGLTKNESKVYMALLKVGKSQSGRIIEEAKISSGKIYETLSRLIDKGLVETMTENGVKQFSITNPQSILEYIKEKEEKINKTKNRIEKIIPELQKIKQSGKNLENVYLIKGIRGIEPLVYGLLEKAKEIEVFGIRSSKQKKFNEFWINWHKKRIKLNKKARVLFSDRGTNYWREFKNMKLTKVKSVLELSPSAVLIMDNNCLIFSYDEELTCIHIISKSIANSFNSFFESMWKIGKT